MRSAERAGRRWWALIAAALIAAALAAACRESAVLDRAQALIREGHGDQAFVLLARERAKDARWAQLVLDAVQDAPGLAAPAADLLAPLGTREDPGEVLLAVRAAKGADRLGQGIAWLERAVPQHPDRPELAIELARLYGQTGRWRASIELLQRSAGDDPQALDTLGFNQLLGGDPEQGRAALERAIASAAATRREYPNAHYHLGVYWQMKGDLRAALGEFDSAVMINPRFLEAQYQRLVVAERLGLADEVAAARAGFAAANRPRLEALNALREPTNAGPEPIDRSAEIEARPIVAETHFRRKFPAGATIEFACRAPRGGAWFQVIARAGSGAQQTFVAVLGEDAPLVWVPQKLDLPPAPLGAEIEVTFDVGPASRWARWLRRPAPTGANFSEPHALGPASARSRDPRPNVLLISLDTLRADHVGAYGAGKDKTPALDALAAHGVRFARAEAAANWTLPSHYSLMSGQSPAAHGVLPDMSQFKGYLYPDRKLALRGSGKEEMLAEALAKVGYRTAAITENGWVSAKFGFDQGFQVYRSDLRGSLPSTLDASLAELETAGTRGPWFVFVHTYTAHQPYHAPLAFRSRWADPAHIGFAWPAARVPIEDYYRFRLAQFPAASSDVEQFRRLYAGQVAYADTLVAALVDWLARRGLAEQTLVVLASDHGEELFEHGSFDHGLTLYEDETHVPLILSLPGRIPPGRVVEGPVSLVDVAATVLDLIGAGERHGEGRSLRPLWEGRPRAGLAPFAMGVHDGAAWRACWDGALKYVRRSAPATVQPAERPASVSPAGGPVPGGEPHVLREELFDLAVDPAETHDLAAVRPEVLALLRQLCAARESDGNAIHRTLGGGEEQLDPETIERLKSLGYAAP